LRNERSPPLCISVCGTSRRPGRSLANIKENRNIVQKVNSAPVISWCSPRRCWRPYRRSVVYSPSSAHPPSVRKFTRAVSISFTPGIYRRTGSNLTLFCCLPGVGGHIGAQSSTVQTTRTHRASESAGVSGCRAAFAGRAATASCRASGPHVRSSDLSAYMSRYIHI